MFKVNNKDTRTTPERRFEHISHLVLVFFIVNFEHVTADWEKGIFVVGLTEKYLKNLVKGSLKFQDCISLKNYV